MADTAAHLVDRVLPEVPIRQWVLTLPYPLRHRCAYDASSRARFLPLPPPNVDEVARVLAGTARRVWRLLAERAGDDEDALARDEPLLTLLTAASLRARIATGPQRGEPWRRLGDRVEPREADEDPEAYFRGVALTVSAVCCS
jgi:hypothetical protein